MFCTHDSLSFLHCDTQKGKGPVFLLCGILYFVTILGYLVLGPSSVPAHSLPILPLTGLTGGHPIVRREQVQLGKAGPSLLMSGPWHSFCCQSGCFLVAFGSLHFFCGFCGRFHPPVWSLSEALTCQTSLFELVPGHLLGR